MSDGVRWYLTLIAMTAAFAPLAKMAAARLSTRGAFLARPFGLLFTVWPLWFLASVTPIPYRTPGLWLTVILAGLLGWLWLWRTRGIDRTWLQSLMAAELLGLTVFLGFCWLRGFTPEITGTEKPMDIAFLSAGARATDMPPLDPWMAGERINYYYVGYLLFGSVARMSGVATWVAFNFALATTVSMTIVAAAGLGFDAVRGMGRRLALAAAALAAFLVVVAGNMLTPARLLHDPRTTWETWWWGGIGWASSRVVIDTGSSQAETINEFPSFSFILGDLHPHVMALPFTIVVLALALNLSRERANIGMLRPQTGPVQANVADVEASGAETSRSLQSAGLTFEIVDATRIDAASEITGGEESSEPNPVIRHDAEVFNVPAQSIITPSRTWLSLATTGVVVGALYPMNSWDLPTFFVAVVVAVLLAVGWTREALIRITVIGAVAAIAWLPFIVRFVPFSGGNTSDVPQALLDTPGLGRIATNVAFFDGERTSAGEFLTVFGLPWLIAVVFLAVELMRTRQETDEPTKRLPKIVIAGIAVVAFLAIGLPAPVLILAGAPLSAAAWLVWQRRGRPADASTLAAVLIAAGLALIVLTEFVYIRDVFEGRFNTLFKVYYQSWTLLGIGGAIALVILWRSTAGWRGGRIVVGSAIGLVLLAGLSYPIVSAHAWTDARRSRDWQGMDGAAFIEGMAPGDLAAIVWLSENAQNGDVVLEAPGCSYQVNGGVPTGRFAAFTGLPTVIGWGGHERQWRGGQPDLQREITPRQEEVAAMYADPNGELARQYGVTLIAVGGFEQNGAGPSCEIAGPFASTSAEFPGPGWTEVFNQDGTRIYRRTG